MTYTITGVIEQVDSTTLRITELPVRRWTQDYKEFLESLVTGTDKIKEPFIKVIFIVDIFCLVRRVLCLKAKQVMKFFICDVSIYF